MEQSRHGQRDMDAFNSTADHHVNVHQLPERSAPYRDHSSPQRQQEAPRVATLTHASWDEPRSFTQSEDRRNRLLGFPIRPAHHTTEAQAQAHSFSSPPLPHWRRMSQSRTAGLLLDESEFARCSDESSGGGPGHSHSSLGSHDRRHGFERRSIEDSSRVLTADDTWPPTAVTQDLHPPNHQFFESVSPNASVVGEKDDDSEDAHSDHDVASPAATHKKSRYLREMDRRVILERLAKGERQAALAKEFNVSRAAICNLFKHRAVVLARSDENPFAKHPKKKVKPSSKPNSAVQATCDRSLASTSSPASGTSTPGAATAKASSASSLATETKPRSICKTLHEVRSQSVQLLVSTLSDRSRSIEDFHRACNRVLWLVLEEALSLVPLKEQYDEELSFSGVSVELPPCAISMERQSLEINPMLDIFHMMEPNYPSGTARVNILESEVKAEIHDEALPESLHQHNVFLLDVVSASGEAVCVVIERLLLDHNAKEANLTVVALFASSEVVAMVQCKYPSVRIVTARVDSSITRRRVALTAVDLILHRMRQLQ